MRRAALIGAWLSLGLLFACADDSDGSRPIECFSIEDCRSDNICFLGNCVDPGFSITTVYAELTPPNDSPYLAQQLPSELDLGDGFQEISLRAAVPFSGTVLIEGAAPGSSSKTGMLQVRSNGTIPGRPVSRYTPVSSSGFDLQVIPGNYDLVFVPDLGNPPHPPIDYPNVDVSSRTDQVLWYPADATLVTVRGQVRSTIDLATFLDGVQVLGTARDASGNALRSTAASTDSNGDFAISFLPGAQIFDIDISPGSNPLVPEISFPGLTVTEPPDGLPDIILGIEPSVTVNAVVRDDQDQPVQNATILFEGTIGDGRFEALGSSNDQGSVQSDLLPGDYTVTVAPQQAQPYAVSSTELTIVDGQSVVQLTVERKVRLSGFVRSHAGEPVSGARVILSRHGLPAKTQRRFSAITGADGWYRVDIDPGDASNPAQYELTVETDRQSGLPWHRDLITVENGDRRLDVALFPPAFAYGRVRDPGGTPLANVIIAFYSEYLLAGEDPLLVGVVQTSDEGEFVLPVPTLTGP